MTITLDTLVSEILDACPESTEVFAKYNVHVLTECHSCLENPLELCETMCGIPDIEGLLKDLQTFFAERGIQG